MTFKADIEKTIREALVISSPQISYAGEDISAEDIILETPRHTDHGDVSCNIAMQLVKNRRCSMAPRQVASKICAALNGQGRGIFEKVEVAGPGFVNFYLPKRIWEKELDAVHTRWADHDIEALGRGQRVHIEFVSANPTGPLHIGHGRGAVVGDVLANLYHRVGYDVTREYYVNDFGNQMMVLGRSVKASVMHQAEGQPYEPEDGWYQGEYIHTIAKRVLENHGKEVSEKQCADEACDMILKDSITVDLDAFGLKPFDVFLRETALYEQGHIEETFNILEQRNLLTERDGARWFCSSKYGDEKDRVVVRENGQPTYLASDMAYHRLKFKNNYDALVDIWGADHHGYVARVRGAMQALGFDASRLHFILVQMVHLLRDGIPVKLSKRAGDYITLRDVIDEVGKDATRFTFLTRRTDSHLEFDLELVKKKSMDNPVYYLQYAYARTCSIFAYAKEQGFMDEGRPSCLDGFGDDEWSLIKQVTGYPEMIVTSVKQQEPYFLVDYLLSLAKMFHSYYNKRRVITDDRVLSAARLYLIKGLQLLFADALSLLGVHAPEKM